MTLGIVAFREKRRRVRVSGVLTKVLDGDPRGAHVTMTWDGRELLGEVVKATYERGLWILDVRHFNGEPWELRPSLGWVDVLERTYEEEVSP